MLSIDPRTYNIPLFCLIHQKWEQPFKVVICAQSVAIPFGSFRTVRPWPDNTYLTMGSTWCIAVNYEQNESLLLLWKIEIYLFECIREGNIHLDVSASSSTSNNINKAQSWPINFFTHLKLWLATATHNFKWVKYTHTCRICIKHIMLI